VAITNELKNYLIQRGISKDKILVAPDGIDLDDFVIIESKAECREKLSLPQDKKLIVYTGQLFKWKGVETLALTSKFLDNNYLIVIVGGIKWYLTDFKHFIEKNNLKNVLCLGHRNYAEIPYFLKAADCLVLTGTQGSEVSRKYTSPLKMFEYMASQTPIIASELSSVKEILNSNNCIFVEPNNAELMANAIKKIIGDIELSENISAQAYKDVQKYTWGIRAKKILVFIKN
jgi:glycosyltransferase involved in cell wall biosynthesis